MSPRDMPIIDSLLCNDKNETSVLTNKKRDVIIFNSDGHVIQISVSNGRTVNGRFYKNNGWSSILLDDQQQILILIHVYPKFIYWEITTDITKSFNMFIFSSSA